MNAIIKQTATSILLGSALTFATVGPSMAEENAIEDARSCISTRTLRNTQIVDDMNILFFVTGKKIFRNILPKQCNGLARNGRFSYTTLSGSLCSFDSIRVLDGSGMQGRSCRLGSFYPIAEVDIAALYGEQNRPMEITAPAPAKVEEITPESNDSSEFEDQ